MPYIPNAFNVYEPTVSREVYTAAEEFRKIKEYLNDLEARLGAITPQRFGAVGSGSIDDTAAIQAFFTHLSTYGGRGYIPSGQYNLRDTVTLTLSGPGFEIVGAGVEAAVFTVNDDFNTAGPAIQLKGNAPTEQAVAFPGFTLRGFSIRAAGAGFHGDCTVGLQVGTESTSLERISGYQWRVISDLLIANFPINLKVVHARMITFRNLGLYADDTPSINLLITQSGLSTNDLVFDVCQFNSSNIVGRSNIVLESLVGPYDPGNGNGSVSGITFRACDIYGGQYAIKIRATGLSRISDIWLVDGCQIDQEVTYAISIMSDMQGTIVENIHCVDGWFNFSGGYAIEMACTGSVQGETVGFIRNIWIVSSTFVRQTTAAITTYGYMDSISGLWIKDNIFVNCGSSGGAIVLNNVADAVISGNTAREDFYFAAKPAYLIEFATGSTNQRTLVTGNIGTSSSLTTACVSIPEVITLVDCDISGNIGAVLDARI